MRPQIPKIAQRILRREFLTFALVVWPAAILICSLSMAAPNRDDAGTEFFERRIRPILVKHCYECHSEQAQEQQGGLLLDRRSGWLQGGDTGKAVVPGQPDGSLLVKAVRYVDADLQMPPDNRLSADEVALLEKWVRLGAPGGRTDLGDTDFSRLGDQDHLKAAAADHWAFQPVTRPDPPDVPDAAWNRHPIDRFVFDALKSKELSPSPLANDRVLLRRLTYDLTGLPPTFTETQRFAEDARKNRPEAIENAVDRLLDSPAFGEHVGRMWLDVARYADTDSFYRPDTRTPHYFPFAFTYRDYVIEALNSDKPFDQFVREQLAADLMGFAEDAPEIAALGFLAVGPHANRNPAEALDDWIDATTRGLLGLTVACARCHDHKFEPIPTTDYYALRGVFDSVIRIHPLDEAKLPLLANYRPTAADRADFEKQRAAIDKKIDAAGGKKASNNSRSIAQKIRETELAELLLFHPGAPSRAMIVRDRPRPVPSFVFIRGEASNRGQEVQRRFLQVLDPTGEPFPPDASGRLELAEKIVDPDNPLTARVFVNRVWGLLIGSHLVATPSDFGLQGSAPTHPELLDWLAGDFVDNGWSVKSLVRQIVLSRTYRQASDHRDDMAAADPENRLLWRANRKHLPIESIRDGMLAVSGKLDRTPRGRPGQLWGENYSSRRSIYGYINRFNLDPTLRVFDFPTPMQTQPTRAESIVAPQALFTMNSPFVIDQAIAVTASARFLDCASDAERASALFELVLQREPQPPEVARVLRFVETQNRFFAEPAKKSAIESPWPLAAQALMMSNEFQYID